MEKIKNYLIDDEIILWSERPNPKMLFFEAGSLCRSVQFGLWLDYNSFYYEYQLFRFFSKRDRNEAFIIFCDTCAFFRFILLANFGTLYI